MLQGKLSAQGSLAGSLHGAAGLSGSLSGGGSSYPSYDGPTEFEPSESEQTIATQGKAVLTDITIDAIPSGYVGSAVDRRDSDDLTASGATVTAPAGYYAEPASKAVASGTEGTPTASKTVSGHTATVTPSVTNTAGYIAGGTHAGSPVTVAASDLVSGTYAVAGSGTHDVTAYASASVASATPTNSSDSEYTTSGGARKWRYRPKTIVPTAGWAGQHSASNPINGFWVTYDAIPTGTTVTPTASAQTIGGADTMMEGAVTVAAIPPEYIVPSGTKAISANGEGIDVAEYAEVDVDVQPTLQSKTATPSTSQQTIAPDSGYDGLSIVTVDAMPSGLVTPDTPTVDSSNGAVTVGWYQQAGHIPQGYYSSTFYDALSTQGAATITPSTSAQTAVAAGKYTTGAVTVSAMPSGSATMPSSMSGSGTIVGALNNTMNVQGTITATPQVSAGYVSAGTSGSTSVSLQTSVTTLNATTYSPQASDRTIAAGTYTIGTQTIKGAPLQSKSVTANGTVTADAGYYGLSSVDVSVSGGSPNLQAKANIAPTTSSQTITADAGYDGLSSVQVNAMPSGTAKPAASISSSGATLSTGTGTIILTKSVTNVPDVTAGYVASGTSGATAITLQATATLKGAITYHPSTSDQAIASGTYLTGAQTIKAVTTSNLTAANIKQGVTVTVGDSTDADCVASVTGTYSGGGSSMNVQVAQSTTRVANTAYTKTASLTCSVAGTYDVYWDCFRSSTSGTNGSQLYIAGSEYGTANTTFASNIHTQTNHLTGVTIAANQEVAVYVRSRGTSYYAYCGTLVIKQTS